MPPEHGQPNQKGNSHSLRQSSTADEVTPLLASSDAFAGAGTQEEPALFELGPNGSTKPGTSDITQSNHEDPDNVPLPKSQIIFLCYARLVEPIAFFSIFPFINKMIQEIGNLDESDVGFYSGLIESLFSCTQMLLMIPWGWAADRIGRKPVLVFSLAGVSVTTALFGFSTTIWQMILYRCLAGVFAGTIVTIRAMLTENTTRKTEARAFSLFAFSGNIGIFIGPLLGGALADPVHQYPKSFQNIAFFKKFPYALPTLVAGAVGASATIISALFTKETLSQKSSDKAHAHPPMSTSEVLKSPGVKKALLLYNYVMVIGYAYTAVCPVYWFTDPSLGGLGFSPLQISIWLGFCGICQAVWLLLIFTPLQHRIGSGGVLRMSTTAIPILYLLCPGLTELLRHHVDTPFWVLFALWCIISSGCAMGYTAVQLGLNAVAPSPNVLGTLNGIALAISAGTRAVAPAMFTSVFAVGVGQHVLNGYLIWLVIALFASGCAAAAWFGLPGQIDHRPGSTTDLVKSRGSGEEADEPQNGVAEEEALLGAD